MSSLLSVQEVSFNNDICKWVGKSSLMTSVQKMEVLKCCWRPPPSYDFAEDAKHLKRKFQYSWLEKYSPWLAYSKHLKGALCLYCVYSFYCTRGSGFLYCKTVYSVQTYA